MTDQTTTDDRWHLTKTTSPRGFAFLPPIPSEYGGHISVSESSAADGPHVWVRATAPVDLNDPDGPTREAAMHLTADNSQRLAEQLQLVVRDHYQGADDSKGTAPDTTDVAAAVRAERDRIKRLLSVPMLAALRCVPDGEIRNGCVIHDGAQVRERLRQAWLAIEAEGPSGDVGGQG